MLRPGEMARMQGAQEAAMADTCVHLVYGATRDPLTGQTVAGYSDGETYACGLSFATGTSSPAMRSAEPAIGEESVETTWLLRLPLAALGVVRPVDGYRITHRFGQALAAPMVLEQVGQPFAGPSGVAVRVRELVL